MRGALRTFAALLALATAPVAGAEGGSFSSSDPLLNQIWNASVGTTTDMLAPGPLTTDADGRPCAIDLPTVLLDGSVRDRCPYVGDQAVTGMTLLVSTPTASPVLRDMILWYAENQHADGAIPASPFEGGQSVLFDYNAFWVEDLYDYVLYTGDLSLATEVWPNLLQLIDDWYPAQMGPDGLLMNSLGASDYGFIPRAGTTVSYYNAGYVLALREAACIAAWIGQTAQAAAWTARIDPVAALFSEVFWDTSKGAFLDASSGAAVHPEDGNAFAVLAGLATLRQGREALDYLSYHDAQPYGATIADNNVWSGYPWGSQPNERVYPFMSYFEVLARYAVGFDTSALALIRREWGDMLTSGTQSRMWETIGPGGTAPEGETPSWDHGWSSGAAPALTNEVLGLTPATPGFAGFALDPHPSGLRWARGAVPTPRGTIDVAWTETANSLTVSVVSPVPGTIETPVAGRLSLDGSPSRLAPRGALVPVSAGRHTLRVVSGAGAEPE